MTELTVLENEATLTNKTFNVYGTVEEPLFMAKDVDDDEKLTGTLFLSGQNREATLLTENGVYEVLILSHKPVANDYEYFLEN